MIKVIMKMLSAVKRKSLRGQLKCGVNYMCSILTPNEMEWTATRITLTQNESKRDDYVTQGKWGKSLIVIDP